ncbi:MAG: CPBP family intramembrane metalloprotease [Synechococcaceae bacterium WB4_1_0192]|nr:CPBP family intramembrane metalloprotease [Synechococcaceae bacterium WB4_1_0192]
MKPHWWGTVLYPAALVGIFLGMQLLFGLLGVAESQRATLGALPAVAALLISLPLRLQRAWGSTTPWRELGVRSSPTTLVRTLLRQRALWLQAALFSLVHTRFNLPPLQLLGLLGGLLLLGLALGLQRRADGGLIWGAIGLHGGLVAGWFLINQGLATVNPAAPAWLIGPANPIGGVLGWLGLALLLLARRRWWGRG